MATEKTPATKEEISEALSKKGINSLEELLDTVMSTETGGFGIAETDGICPQDSNPDPSSRVKGRPFQGGPDGFDTPSFHLFEMIRFLI